MRFVSALGVIFVTGCGPAVFFEDVSTNERAAEARPVEAPARPEPPGRHDGFADNLGGVGDGDEVEVFAESAD